MPGWRRASPAPGPRGAPPAEMDVADRPRVLVVGDLATDVLVRLAEPIAIGSDARAEIAVRPGGSAANQAAWLASEGMDAHFRGPRRPGPLQSLPGRGAGARRGHAAPGAGPRALR